MPILRLISVAVKTGPGASKDLDMDGSRGALLEVSGNLDIDVFGFFQVSGGFALSKSTGTITLSDTAATELTVDQLTLGASNVSAFAGIAGGTSDAVGLELTDVEFALGIFSDQADPTRTWTALQATAGSFGFIGVEDLSVTGTTLSVSINQAPVGEDVANFAVNSVAVKTGPSSSKDLDLDGSRGELLEVSGNLDIDVFGFFQVSGGFALSKSTGTITLSDTAATEVTVDQLTLGASNVSAFAGIAGGTVDAVGLELTDVEFALGIFSDQADPTRTWTALQATAGSFGFIGVEDLSVTGHDFISLD